MQTQHEIAEGKFRRFFKGCAAGAVFELLVIFATNYKFSPFEATAIILGFGFVGASWLL